MTSRSPPPITTMSARAYKRVYIYRQGQGRGDITFSSDEQEPSNNNNLASSNTVCARNAADAQPVVSARAGGELAAEGDEPGSELFLTSTARSSMSAGERNDDMLLPRDGDTWLMVGSLLLLRCIDINDTSNTTCDCTTTAAAL